MKRIAGYAKICFPGISILHTTLRKAKTNEKTLHQTVPRRAKRIFFYVHFKMAATNRD